MLVLQYRTPNGLCRTKGRGWLKQHDTIHDPMDSFIFIQHLHHYVKTASGVCGQMRRSHTENTATKRTGNIRNRHVIR
ncbi:hypothetical protein PS664_01897 [Pseudomonas fluorescens]|nr:hypothetical protein PS664_01897 [Pseudomonas fluorescens]